MKLDYIVYWIGNQPITEWVKRSKAEEINTKYKVSRWLRA